MVPSHARAPTARPRAMSTTMMMMTTTSRLASSPSTSSRATRCVRARADASPSPSSFRGAADGDGDADAEDVFARASVDVGTSSASALAVSRARWTGEGETEDESGERGAELFFRFARSHAESTARALSSGVDEDEDEDEDESDEGVGDDRGDAWRGDTKCMIYLRGVGGATRVRLTRVAAWPRKSSASSSVSFTGDWDEDGVNGAGDATSASDDAEGANAIDWDAPEETLAAQKTFDLPSANAAVACLTYEDALVGLIVVERTRRSSASASAFTKREKRTLEAFASAFVDAWAIHRNGVIALGATYRANQTVGGYLYESRRPLTALRTLGGMLKTYLKPDDPAGDMAEALVRQGDALAELSAKLESALYPTKSASEMGALYNTGGDGAMDRKTTRLLPNAADDRDALVAASRDEMCDVTKVAIALLASSDVVASSEGVVTRARLPENDGPSRTVVYANPMDVRSALAQVIDVALVSSPRDAVVDVCVCEASADGFVDVEVNVDTSNVSLPIEARMNEHTPGLRIAKRLVERAGGWFEVRNDDALDSATVRVRYPARRA
jgi:hypothetical protein